MLSFCLRSRAASAYALLGCLSANPAFASLTGFTGATAAAASTLLLTQAPAQAQSAPAAARAAQAITVRLEGATQGSGVLVKREGNRYTVLTAWHVVSGQRPGEELAIITPDGKQHRLEQGSIQRLGQVDLAVLSFLSSSSYAVARIGDPNRLEMGGSVYVAGFPISTSAVPARILRFLDGRVIANSRVAIPNGYQLLYSNQTQRGMSGGAVLDDSGQLVGIHGQAETDNLPTADEGVAIKTGTSQGIPISYYRGTSAATAGSHPNRDARSVDDFLALARELLGQEGREQEVIRLASQSLALHESADGYVIRAYVKTELGDKQGAIADYNQALAINPKLVEAYHNRAAVKADLGDKQGALADLNQALAINPRHASSYTGRGVVKRSLGDNQGAFADYSQALAINPKYTDAFVNRGNVKADLGDYQGAIADFNQALAINPSHAYAYLNRGVTKSDLGDNQGAVADYNQALAINPKFTDAFVSRGNAKTRLGDYQGAIADYNQALAINSKYASAYSGRGIAKSSLGDNQGAIADYNQALAINPRLAIAYSGRGFAKSDLGDKQGAIADYNQALAINPKYTEAFSNRGRLRFVLGDKHGACDDFKKAVALNDKIVTRWLQSPEAAWCRNLEAEPRPLDAYQRAIEAQQEMMRQIMGR